MWGLAQQDYEGRLKEQNLTTLTEKRHSAEMHTVHKILKAEDRIDPRAWFEMATRVTADQLNIKPDWTSEGSFVKQE